MTKEKRPPAENPDELRRLVACPQCKSQFDVGSLPVGHRFHCTCGTSVTIPPQKTHHSKVVRCSSCGGPRAGREPVCSFCGAQFTLHERDLHTICPSCLTRIADRSRFCHCCGIPIAPQRLPNKKSHLRCPACRAQPRLLERQLTTDVPALECGRCGGLWLGHELFVLLQQRAIEQQVEQLRPQPAASAPTRPQSTLYRRCPQCGCHMNRRNFKKRSGVILDICPQDGIWLDLGELDRLLGWIRQGGLAAASNREEQRRREANFLKDYQRLGDPMAGPLSDHDLSSRKDLASGIVGGLVNLLLER